MPELIRNNVYISNTEAFLTEDGWERFGPSCPSKRRSLWVKFEYINPDFPSRGDDNILSLEICGGREGGDLHWKFTKDEPCFIAIVDMINTGLFIIELSNH